MITNLNDIIKESIHPLLKALGFRKKGNRWNRTRGDFVDVLTVQRATYSTPEKEIFTINLGVFVSSFHEIVWQYPLSKFATEAECPIRLRLGDLMQKKSSGHNYDQWWTIDRDSQNAEFIGKEIEEALRKIGIPFLEQFDTFAAIAEYLQKVKGWQSKNTLILLYRALAEWKIESSQRALETLSIIKKGTWDNKIDIVREVIQLG